ncbi:MAG: multidrug efflux RND transporter permease subunit [Nitrospirae bacterium]|nr:multidrug efflux RND transporter permease subunit [Nitrospirota bacterium]
MFNFFIDRPVLSSVISLVILLAGAIAGFGLPKAQYPQIIPPQVQVSTIFPGANSQVVTESIASPLEQQINGADDMLYMDSKSSNDGAYNLTITFEVGTDQDLAAVDVQNRISIAQSALPSDVIRQGVIVRKSSSDFLSVISLTSPSGKYDALFLSNYATLNLVDAIARIKGVGSVRVFGARDYSMRVWLDPDRMARLGVTAGDIANVIREQNVVAPAGRLGLPPGLPGQQMQFTATVQGRLKDVKEYEDMIIRGLPDGRLVRMKDVARIQLAAVDYSINAAEDGKPAALVGIFLQPDADALKVAQAVEKTMAEMSKGFPDGVVYAMPYSTTPFVTESMKEVALTLSIAFLLVVLVVYIFLQSPRATLIPMLAVPVSIVGTMSAFAALGFSLNMLTLFGLILAIGIVVDDAIVVVEAVQHKIDAFGMDAKKATKAAMSEVGGPVVAIALVLSAVFIPVAFLGGLTGQLYKQFALTLAVSVLLSAVVALTLTPALCALLLKPRMTEHKFAVAKWFFGWFNSFFDRFQRGYHASVVRFIRHGALVMLTFLVLAGVMYFMVKTRPTGLVPEEDQGYLISIVTLPPAASLERTTAVTNQMQAMLKETPGVAGSVAIAGLNLFTFTTTSYNATVFIRLKPWEKRNSPDTTARAIQGKLMGMLNMTLKDANVLVVNPPPIRGLGTTSGFELVLQDKSGGSVEKFNGVLHEFIGKLFQDPAVGFAFTTFDTNIPQIEYVVDREKVKSLGVQLSDVFFSLQMFLCGNYVNDFNLFGRTFKVVAQGEAAMRAHPEDVKRLYVRNNKGDMIPLSTLLSIKRTNGPEYLERYNLYRAVTINGGPKPGVSSGQAIAAVEKLAESLPEGYGIDWTGSTYQEKKTAGQTGYIFLLSILFVFLVLAALYESWTLPVSILLVIPFGVLGAFSGLILRGLDNNVFVQIGLIMLIGLAAKNAVLIVEFAMISRERGMGIVDAAIAGARLRLRPILMTSFAFIFGTLPLAVAHGAGAGARRSLGTAVVFGMLFATMIGIFIIPVYYVVIESLSERKNPFRKENSTPREQAPGEMGE